MIHKTKSQSVAQIRSLLPTRFTRSQDKSVQFEDGCTNLLKIRLGRANATQPDIELQFRIVLALPYGSSGLSIL